DKNDKVYIRSCGIDSFGAADVCETFGPADDKKGVSTTFCNHCDQNLCNDYRSKGTYFYKTTSFIASNLLVFLSFAII
ncbi:hypothetical protein L9F63_013060, partial [Diploptera punctata]